MDHVLTHLRVRTQDWRRAALDLEYSCKDRENSENLEASFNSIDTMV